MKIEKRKPEIPISPARNTDPETSHEALENHKLAKEQRKMLTVFGSGREYNSYEAMRASEGVIDPYSTYWHRCTDLERAGLLELTGAKRPGRTKKNMQVYVITDRGREYL